MTMTSDALALRPLPPASARLTLHLLLPDLCAAGVKLSTPPLLMAGPAANRAAAASSQSIARRSSSSSPGPALMAVAQAALKELEPSVTLMGEGPGVKVGA
jgi:hypothetical protein